MNTTRTRKLVGMAGLLIGLILYAAAVLYVAVEFLPSHWAIELIYYTVFGVAWAFPAKYLMVWIHAPDAEGDGPA